MPTNNIADYNLNADNAAPGEDAALVTPNDTTDLPLKPARSLYIGTGGNVEVITARGTTIIIPNIPSGTILPLKVTRVRAALTTASDIVAIY